MGGQQREAQEKSRKLSVRRSLLAHDDKIPEQQASLGEGVTKTLCCSFVKTVLRSGSAGKINNS